MLFTRYKTYLTFLISEVPSLILTFLYISSHSIHGTIVMLMCFAVYF